ncbi:glycosyltransferase family 2 protein [Microvirga terricola]|uniref:Glycosyltransferase n=1 Tax=Microvirga terricola TaxID=2719797 RepID=A0ABX0VEB9_9HYPH|nr:glycosyltransferase family 2 protein [Microvirga terricola]NIX78175.1 glycosyltransferase [Microvirga terricola]
MSSALHNALLPTDLGLVEDQAASTGRQAPLALEVGFLARHGYSSGNLRDATTFAGLTGTPVDEFLLKYSLIDETAFYRALAAELSVPFLSVPHLSPKARYPDSILTGMAPLAGGGFVLAPRGPAIVHLLKNRRAPGGPLAIATPSSFTRAVFRDRAKAIAHHASNALPDRKPHLSNRDGLTTSQIAALSALALLASFVGVSAPAIALHGLALSMALLFLGMVVLRLAASLLHNPIEPAALPPRVDDADLPVYRIIAALYREKNVAAKLVAALMRLDYPRAKLDVKLVLEADDKETLNALTATGLPGFMEIIIAPPGYPRTKPRALNVALSLARGAFTVIYDAEDVPESGQLRLAVASFAAQPPDVVCLQARLTIDNTDDSWLTRLFTIEYAALFDVLNPGLAEIGCPITLGGTSNHFRTATLKELGGWDAWNVTEDADLGIRLARFGYRVADLPSSTWEEAPSTLKAWMHQRTRWMKGYMQTCISHSRRPHQTLSELGLWRFYGAVVVTLGTVLSALGYPFFTAAFLLLSTSVPTDSIASAWLAGSRTLFVLGALAMVAPALLALRRRGLIQLAPWVLALPAYYLLVSVACWRGLWDLVFRPFWWSKTFHGLGRTSRFRSTRRGERGSGR